MSLYRWMAVGFPVMFVLTWSAAAGCAHGDGDDVVRGDDRLPAAMDAGSSAPDVSLFPTEAPSSSSDASPTVVIDPDRDVSVAHDAGHTDANSSIDAIGGVDACQSGCDCTVPVTLSYDGPAFPGTNWVEAWWQPPGVSPRPWGVIPECTDPIAGDGRLECTFAVPCGTSSFEFQVYLPYARYWGDMSCLSGGCGSTVGTVLLRTPSGPLSYVMIPNPWGDPWRNGFAAFVY